MKKTSVSTLLGLALSLGAFAQQDHLSIGSYSGQSEITALKSVTLTNGFHIPSGSNVRLYLLSAPFLTSAPSSGQNYILTRTFRKPVKASELGSARSIKDENQSVQYFDGLGRPLQNVELMASPAYKDIVQHIEYDGFGRESKKYLPYAEQSSANGSFKTTAGANQKVYYASTGSWDAHVAKTTRPYSETVFENSPLNRVKEQGAPGAVWQPGATRTASGGRTMVTDYGTNVTTALEAVKLWKPTYDASGKPTGATSTTNYLGGKLYKTVIKDENWVNVSTDPNVPTKTGTVEEYKDFEDRVVLKRVWETESKKLDTYYIYDDFGDLRYVVPPAVTVASFTTQSGDANFEHYIYGYNYDGRRRLTEKKIPGKGWEYFVYNVNDQLILSQDAMQRNRKEWTYIRYDAFGRITSTGLYTNINTEQLTLSEMNRLVSAASGPLWETRVGADYPSPSTTFPLPGSGITIKPHIINYYDDYGFKTPTVLPATSGLDSTSRVRGLLTGVLVSKDDGTSPLLTVNYYDDKARLIQSMANNHMGGTDRVTNTYSFVGELETSTREHKPSSTATVTIIKTIHSYDHVGRLVETKKKIGSAAEIVQSRLSYNEIGQLKQKDLHVNGSSAVQEIQYSYNERGWLTGINDPSSIGLKKRFGMHLGYANRAGTYNGNIGTVSWNTKVGDLQIQPKVQKFTYDYDKLNRLTSASYSDADNLKNGFYDEILDYDVMGNIQRLKRTNGSTALFNDFSYAYTGNMLNSVTDAGTARRSNTFAYNANGSARANSRIGITDIEYNYLNLPKKFVKGSTPLVYTYDATGKKLGKQFGGSHTQYVDGLQYKDGVLEFIQTEEGRILPNGSSFIYEYFLQDHLGNTRAVVDHSGALKQITDYYAFGMEMNRGSALNPTSNLYKYNGKEQQLELGLDQYDYGARFYDAEIGRWNVVDPLAEKGRRWSVYTYTFNNPIRFVDPDGMWATPPDWFVNNKTGEVTFLKNVSDLSSLSNQEREAYKISDNLNDYENIGSDNMFGDKVQWNGIDGSLLDYDAVMMNDASQAFMKFYNYVKAERIEVRESQNTEYSTDRTRHLMDKLYTQIGDSKITYVEPNKLRTSSVIKEPEIDYYSFSSTMYSVSNYIVPYGESKDVLRNLNSGKGISMPRIKGQKIDNMGLFKSLLDLFPLKSKK